MLQYVWKAHYMDETKLHQFEEDDKETLFKEIEQNKLKFFAIDSKDNDHFVMVNLENGEIVIDGTILTFEGLVNREEDYRLIYFRRVTKDMISGPGTLKEAGTTTRHFIGFQITIDDKNSKVMIEVNDKHQFKIHTK